MIHEFWKIGQAYKHLDYKCKWIAKAFTDTHVILHSIETPMNLLVPNSTKHIFMYKCPLV